MPGILDLDGTVFDLSAGEVEGLDQTKPMRLNLCSNTAQFLEPQVNNTEKADRHMTTAKGISRRPQAHPGC